MDLQQSENMLRKLGCPEWWYTVEHQKKFLGTFELQDSLLDQPLKEKERKEGVMSDDAPRTVEPLTLDDVIRAVTEIARDPESRDRLRALKLLTSLNQSVAAVPPPLTDEEVVERMKTKTKDKP